MLTSGTSSPLGFFVEELLLGWAGDVLAYKGTAQADQERSQQCYCKPQLCKRR